MVVPALSPGSASIVERLAARLDPAPSPYTADPVGWVQNRLLEFIWSKQRAILESVVRNPRTGVPACHDSGKSFIAARAAAWWLDTHRAGEAFVVTTAPTFSQVRAILWREIGKAHRKGQLSGRVNQTEWLIDRTGRHYTSAAPQEELVAIGRKPSEYDQAAFQGIHARYVLVIIDEADGVAGELFDAAETLATNEHARILAIGNPVDPTSAFASAVRLPATIDPDSGAADEFDSPSGWHVVRIDGYDTPNFTKEPVPDELRDMLLSPAWVESMVTKFGAGSSWVVGRIRGRHPIDSEDGVIPGSKIRACRHLDDDGTPFPAESLWDAEQLLPIELGVDVGAGGDQSVVRERRGIRTGRVWRQRSPDTMDLVDLVLAAILVTGATAVKIDTVGIGKGAGDRLEQLRRQGRHTARIIPVNVGERALAPAQYVRLRDQIWWEVGRGLIEDGALDLSELDEETFTDLTAPRLMPPDAANRIQVEPKKETRKRIGRSPDDADAWLLAYLAIRPQPQEGYVVHDQQVRVSPY
ncbi:MAG TPA: hypothetical protein VEW95_09495 [Candidatus Limnocylindrales bacterium]|nr:hypothetical protein [Candidatus Limnocylindrales bacterium]